MMEPNARGFSWPRGTKLYHATTALDALLGEGFKTREQLGGRHATGGGPETAISFTFDARVAQAICLGLRTLARGSRGSMLLGDMIIEARGIAPKGVDDLIKAEKMTPEVVVNLDEGLYPFHWGMGWSKYGRGVDLSEKHLDELLATEDSRIIVEPDFADPRATKPFRVDGWAPLEILAPYDRWGDADRWRYRPWFYDSYQRILAMGETIYNPLFIFTDLKAMAEQDEDQIGIVEVELDAEWLCADPREGVALGYEEAARFGTYGFDWHRSCESRLDDLASGKEYQHYSRPPVEGWELADPKDTVAYLGRSMAEIRVFDPTMIRDVRLFESMDDVNQSAEVEWFNRRSIEVEEPIAWPMFESETPRIAKEVRASA